MRDILLTFEVLKFVKSKYFNSLHDSNIPLIFITLSVINLFKPFISFNFLQPANIPSILLTFEVSKLDKSKYSNSLHKQNIPFIIFTLFVRNVFENFISFKLVQLQNIASILITFEVSKLDKSKYFIH